MAHEYCNGKIIYESPQAAHQALASLEQRRAGRHVKPRVDRRPGRGKLRVEPKCESCHKWHLTSAPVKVKRKTSRR